MQTISRNELISFLNAYPGNVYVIDDREIDPLEIIVIISQIDRKATESLSEFADFICDEDGERRKLIWMNEKKFGLISWTASWRKRYQKKEDNIYNLSIEDRDAFTLWMAFFMSEKSTWLRINATQVIKGRYSYSSDNELYIFLAKYIKKYKIHPKYKCICDMPVIFAEIQNKRELLTYRLVQFRLKIYRKAVLKRLTIETFFHNLRNKKRFIKNLKKEGTLPERWEVINSGKGSSSSTLIKAYRDGWIEFIKGNELKEYNSLPNEISAQKKLCENYQYPHERWYLGMTSAGKNEKWIGYPFLKYVDLSAFIKENTLSDKQLEKLGMFLCEAVEKMKKINIVHNDLRTDNVSLTIQENQDIEFRLIDFGCAYVDGKSPWVNNYWGRYFGNVVCGDYRYSNWIVDDAASAYLVYIECGGKQEDKFAQKLKDLFGKTLFSIPYEWYGEK